MSQYNVPFLSLDTQIVNENGTMTQEMLNFVKGMSDLFNNNFNATGLKVPDQPTTINVNENGTIWYNNNTNTAQILVDGQPHNFNTTLASTVGIQFPQVNDVNTIENPVSGTVIYDTSDQILKVYTTTWIDLHA